MTCRDVEPSGEGPHGKLGHVPVSPLPCELGHVPVLLRDIRTLRPAPENDKVYRPISADDPDVQALADDIARNGVLEPLVVNHEGFILSGHRRHAACLLSKIFTVPCRVLEIDRDDPAFANLLISFNRQRVKNFDEVAREEVMAANPEEAYRALVEHRRGKGRVQVEAIRLYGKSRRDRISPAKRPFLEGKRLLIGHQNGEMTLRDAVTGKVQLSFKGHTDRVICASFSPDGSKLVSACLKQAPIIWDLKDGRELNKLSGHAEQVMSLAFSSDGVRILSLGGDKTLKVWDDRTGKDVASRHDEALSCLKAVYSPDGRNICALCTDHIKIWDGSLARELRTIQGPKSDSPAPLMFLSFSPDGKRLAAGGMMHHGVVWEWPGENLVANFKDHVDSAITSWGLLTTTLWVGFSADSQALVSVSLADPVVRIRDVSGVHRISLPSVNADSSSASTLHAAVWRPIAINPKRPELAIAEQQNIVFWSIETLDLPPRELSEKQGHQYLHAAAFRDGKNLIVGASFGSAGAGGCSIGVLNRTTGRVLDHILSSPNGSPLSALAVSPDDCQIAYAEVSLEGLRINDVPAGKGSVVYVEKIHEKKLMHKLQIHEGSVLSIAFSPDGTSLVTGGEDASLLPVSTRDGRSRCNHSSWGREQRLAEMAVRR